MSRALNGARSTVSIFMLSSTSTGAPASTSAPTASGVATTSAGAGERTTPPSSRLTRCVTPSTSTRWIGPCVLGEQAVPGAVDDDPAGVPVEAVELDVGGADVVAGLDADPEPVRADPRDADAVAGAAQLEVQRAAALVLHLRASAGRRRQQPLPLDALLLLVRLDGGGGQRDRGVPVRDEPALAADPVDPAGVRAGVDHLGLVEQVEHEALVRRAALDDHRGLRHRPAQPAERLVAVAP